MLGRVANEGGEAQARARAGEAGVSQDADLPLPLETLRPCSSKEAEDADYKGGDEENHGKRYRSNKQPNRQGA